MGKQHLAFVEACAEPVRGMRLLFLSCAGLSASAKPGQYVMVRCGQAYDPYLRYPLPIHRFMGGQGIALLFRPLGAGLSWLGGRRVGDALDLFGPCGHGFDLPQPGASLSLVSWGLGLAPLLGILDHTTGAVRLVMQAPTSQQLYPRELLPRQVEYVPYVGQRDSEGFWQAVAESCRWGERLYAAGVSARDLADADGAFRRLRQAVGMGSLGLRPALAQVWVEAEMACGQGFCQGCLVETRRGPRRACVEGPVFDLAELG